MSRPAEKVGRLDGFERDLFVLDLAGPESFPASTGISSPRYVCLLAWDAAAAAQEELRVLARRLLDSGAVWIACWGPDCARVHDAIDAEFAAWPNREPEGVVMTTWHTNDSLPNVIQFSLLGLCPDECYSDGCGAIVGIAIGNSQWAAEIRSAYSNSRTGS